MGLRLRTLVAAQPSTDVPVASLTYRTLTLDRARRPMPLLLGQDYTPLRVRAQWQTYLFIARSRSGQGI